jgi:hypothetical protein
MSNNKQQTAVEWYVEQLRNNENIRWRGTPFFELSDQAKEMEKKQHEKTYNQSLFSNFATFEDYYNETYGGNK